MKKENTAKLLMAISMLIFGTVPLVVRTIDLSSSERALYRAIMAAVLVGGFLLLSGQKIVLKGAGRELWLLLISGGAMGINWILLFEAYRYTTVATATLCYYMAPIFVILLSPVLLKERLTLRKLLCVAAALAGMVLVSGVYALYITLLVET